MSRSIRTSANRLVGIMLLTSLSPDVLSDIIGWLYSFVDVWRCS